MPFVPSLLIYHRYPNSGLHGNEFLLWYSVPFILVLIYFIYRFISDQNSVMNWFQGKVPRDLKANDKNLAEIFVVFCACMTKRGKAMIRAKEQAIDNLIQSYFPGTRIRTDEIFDFALKNRIDVVSLADWCAKTLSEKEKIKLFQFLAWLADVDEEILDEERELLHFVYNRLGISFDDLDEKTQKILEYRETPQVTISLGMREKCLQVLGLSEDDTLEDIKKAYRSLVKEVHPDRHPTASPVQRKILETRFQEIQSAYEFLT